MTVDFGFVPECTEFTLLVGDILQPDPPGGNQLMEFPFGSGAVAPPICGMRPDIGGQGMAFDDANGYAYIAEPNGDIVRINRITGEQTTVYNPGYGAFDLSISPDGSVLYMTGPTGLDMIDAATGTLLGYLDPADFAGGPDGHVWGVDVNPLTGEVYVTRGFQGSDPTTGAIFKVPADFSTVPPGNQSSETPVKIADAPVAGQELMGIEFLPDGTFWVAAPVDTGSGVPDEIQHYAADGTLLQRVDVPETLVASPENPAVTLPNSIEFGPDGKIYVGTWYNYCVLRYDPVADSWEEYLALDPNARAKAIAFSCGSVICKTAVGNLVFEDSNGNGVYDAGTDNGIDGVTVQLFSTGADGNIGGGDDVEIDVGPDGILGTADDAAGGMQTSGGGGYLFRQLDPGNYYVLIPSSEFGAGQELENLQSVTGQGGDNGVRRQRRRERRRRRKRWRDFDGSRPRLRQRADRRSGF